MQSLLQQGDARPERVLRRFFSGLAEVWRQFHILDKAFLPPGKKFRIQVELEPGTNPYLEMVDPQVLEGDFDFEFGANILNSNRALASQATQEILGVIVNPLLLQVGIVTPQHIYNALKEVIRAKGQVPQKYIQPPMGQVDDGRPLFSAEDAINAACNGVMPYGKAMEPLEEHLAKLLQFMQIVGTQQNPDMLISGQGARILGVYVGQVQQELAQQQQMQQMLANAQAMQEQIQQGDGKPGPKGETDPGDQGPGGNPPVKGKELMDESLPGAGGGANP
jgi:hypothetical protein